MLQHGDDHAGYFAFVLQRDERGCAEQMLQQPRVHWFRKPRPSKRSAFARQVAETSAADAMRASPVMPVVRSAASGWIAILVAGSLRR